MPDLSTYATKSELSGYLPLSGGTLTGALATPQITNLLSITFSPDINPNGGVSIMASNGILMFNSSTTNGSGTVLFASNKVQTAVVPEVISGSEFLPLYYSGNFQAGVDYVAPSTLNNYLPLSGGTLTGTLNIATENKIQVGTISIANNSGSGSISIGNSGSITRSLEPDTSIEIIGSGVCIRSMNDSNGDTFKVTSSGIIFNDNHVLTEADTFNTITYTTSASEDNLRAWNNYVNGYVTNLRIVDIALTSYIRVVNGVDIEDKKFDVYVIGGDPVRLVRAEYTLADNGSVTKSTVNYTLTLATA